MHDAPVPRTTTTIRAVHWSHLNNTTVHADSVNSFQTVAVPNKGPLNHRAAPPPPIHTHTQSSVYARAATYPTDTGAEYPPPQNNNIKNSTPPPNPSPTNQPNNNTNKQTNTKTVKRVTNQALARPLLPPTPCQMTTTTAKTK